MSEFAPTDSALEGFRLAREHPSAIGIWAVISLVLSLITYALLLSAAGPQVAALMDIVTKAQTTPGAPRPDPEAMAALVNAMGTAMLPVYPAMLGVSLVANAVLSGANMRMVLRPEDRSPGYLRFGGDELRILAVMIVKLIIFFGLTIIGSLVMGLSAGLLGVAGVLLALLLFFALIAVAVVIAVRLSLATPQTFAERRIMIFQSWGLTAGKFGPLLGCYLLTLVLIIVVAIVGSLATGAITLIIGMIAGSAPKVDFSSMQTFFTPLQVVNLVIGSVIGALTLAIKGSPPAVIYQRLTGGGNQAVFS